MNLFNRLRPRRDPVLPDEDDIIAYEEPDDPAPESVYLETVRHYIDKQITAYDVLDVKTHQYFATGGLAFTVTFALINLAPDRGKAPIQALVALGVALLAYGFVIGFVAAAGRHKSIGYGPFPDMVQALSFGPLPGIGLQRWVADVYTDAARDNNVTLKRKGVWVGWAAVSLWAEGFSLALATILTLWLGL